MSILLLIIGLLSTVAISTLLRPAELSDDAFYLSVLWVSFLLFLNWLVSFYFFSNTKNYQRSTRFGIIPSLHVVLFIYSVISVSLLIAGFYLNEFQKLPTWHWVFQVVSFGFCSSVVLLLNMSSNLASIEVPIGVASKEEVLKKINLIKINTPSDSKEIISRLTNVENLIKFSIPHLSVLKNMESWVQLASEVFSIDVGDFSVDYVISKLKDIEKLAKSC